MIAERVLLWLISAPFIWIEAVYAGRAFEDGNYDRAALDVGLILILAAVVLYCLHLIKKS